ncbi:MAG: MarR family transcriptional regulator [Chitinophagaceae bacterium]|nr:MarR family transcriptional regulator [Chitinophagaceae bacterium]
MSLEKDINQRAFRNDYQKSIVNLIYTYNWMNEKMNSFFDKEGVTAQQYNILRILRGAGTPISTLQIRERMLDKMSDTSRIVDRLVLKGLAKKSVCKNDKRLVDVSISTKGKSLLEKMDKYDKDMDAILGNLSESESKTLNNLLDKIRQSG